MVPMWVDTIKFNLCKQITNRDDPVRDPDDGIYFYYEQRRKNNQK